MLVVGVGCLLILEYKPSEHGMGGIMSALFGSEYKSEADVIASLIRGTIMGSLCKCVRSC